MRIIKRIICLLKGHDKIYRSRMVLGVTFEIEECERCHGYSYLANILE